MSFAQPQRETLFGHPAGLYMLFFAEMWERFSYYGMRALLVFYMNKDFLQYGDAEAYGVYGIYTSLVYMTPFFGGMLADRLLGARHAVVIGGLLMAAGQLLLTVRDRFAFFFALALLIAGNGFFKPNISNIVGTLYTQLSHKRDAGFTIFYMGINLGASMSPLLCGYVGETYGWHWGFGLAAIGMLAGLAVFVVPGYLARLVIMATALSAAAGLILFRPDNPFLIGVNLFVAAALVAAAGVAWAAISRGGLPQDAGRPLHPERLNQPMLAGLSAKHTVYLGAALAIPLLALLTSGFSLLRTVEHPTINASESNAPRAPKSAADDVKKPIVEPDEAPTADTPWAKATAVIMKQVSQPAGLVLFLSGLIAFGYLGIETFRLERLARERMFVVLILTSFSMLFFAFFEQAGSSLNNFADRNVDRVPEQAGVVKESDVGRTIRLQPTQEQLGYHNGDDLFTIDALGRLRDKHADQPEFEIDWEVAEDDVGMRWANRSAEIPASVFQAVNPICILVFGLVFTAAWGFLGNRGLEPSTPFKFALGLLLLGLGFGVFWLGAQSSDQRGMVGVGWLLLGYLLQTTGELCLSPVGLSMVSKLSPKQLVSTVMGAWFLAAAFAQLLAGIIAQFTGVEQAGGASGSLPAPIATVHIYGDVYGRIAIAAVISAAICFALVPLLKRWMHPEDDREQIDGGAPTG